MSRCVDSVSFLSAPYYHKQATARGGQAVGETHTRASAVAMAVFFLSSSKLTGAKGCCASCDGRDTNGSLF